MTIGQRIRDRRIELNLNPKDIANKIGKSLSTYYRYETGEIEKLTVSKMIEISEILDISPAYLLFGSQFDHYKKPENKYSLISFSEKLRDLMIAGRLTNEGLISELFNEYNIKITLKDIENWNSGAESPDISSFIAIADFFNVSVDFLIGKSEVNAECTKGLKAKEASAQYNKACFAVKNLSKFLNASDYTIEKMAELTSIDINIIKDYYNGNLSKVNSQHAKKIADILKISVIDIMYERNTGPIVEKLSQLDAVQLYDVENYINKILSI